MAEGKNSIIFYRDWKEIFESLSDKDCAELIRHIFRYVNDENPISKNPVVNAVFIPIKSTLKRDLKKWESIKERNKLNGSKGGRPKNPKKAKKPTGLFGNPKKPKKPDSDSVSVSDSVSDKEVNNNKFNFKNSLIEIGVSEQTASDWLKVRQKKKAANTETAFKSIKREIDKSGRPADECIEHAVINNWQGFKAEWLKNTTHETYQRNHSTIQKAKAGDGSDIKTTWD